MHEAPQPLAAGETLRLRVFLDRSSVDAFAQDRRVVLTDRIYPDARPAHLFGFIAAIICSRRPGPSARTTPVETPAES